MQQFIGGYEIEESLDPLLRLDCLADLFILGLALQRSLVLNRKLNRSAVHQYGRDAVIHFCIGGRGRQIQDSNERLRNPTSQLVVDRQCQTDIVHLQGMWYLVLIRVLLAIDRRAEVVNSKTLQGLQAIPRNRIQSVAIQHWQGLFPHQAAVNHATDSPIEDRPIAIEVVQLREAKQLHVRHVAGVGNELKQALVFEIVQIKRSLAIAHLRPTPGGMLTPDTNSVQTGKISLFFRYARCSEIRILDVCATVPIHFVFADGLIAMEETATLNALR